MRRIALVFAGGFCGTLARYLVSAPLLALAALLVPGQRGGFPYDILLINLAGALAMGWLYGLFERGVALSPDVRVTLGTGFLGAFTTFSSLAYGGDKLLLAGAPLAALLYFALSMALGVLCARLGVALAVVVADRRHLVRRVRARIHATGRIAVGPRTTGRTAAHGHVQPHTLATRHPAHASGANHHVPSHAAHSHDHQNRHDLHHHDQHPRHTAAHRPATHSAHRPEETLEVLEEN